MAEKFMFYENFLNAIEQLDDDLKAEACLALCRYGVTGELPENKIFRFFCIGVSASVQKYDGRQNNGGNHNPNGKNQHTEEVNSGQSGQSLVNSGQSGQSGQKTEKRSIPLKTETETETETGRVTPLYPPSGTSERGAKRFVRPSVDEVRAYCEERGNGIDPQDFVDFYESKGWVVGKSPMKDWKAAVRTWEGKRARVVKAEPEPEPFFWDNQLNCGEVDGVAYYAWTDYYEAVKAFREKKGA